MPDLDRPRCKQDRQRDRRGRDGQVRGDHDHAAVPTVHERANERTEQCLWQDGRQRGRRQHSGRPRLLGQVPDQRELHQSAPKDGEGLACENGEILFCPVLWDQLVGTLHGGLNKTSVLI